MTSLYDSVCRAMESPGFVKTHPTSAQFLRDRIGGDPLFFFPDALSFLDTTMKIIEDDVGLDTRLELHLPFHSLVVVDGLGCLTLLNVTGEREYHFATFSPVCTIEDPDTADRVASPESILEMRIAEPGKPLGMRELAMGHLLAMCVGRVKTASLDQFEVVVDSQSFVPCKRHADVVDFAVAASLGDATHRDPDTGKATRQPNPKRVREVVGQTMAQRARFAFLAASMTCHPTNWIIEQMPPDQHAEKRKAKGKPTPKIPRDHQRRKLLVWSREKVRKVYADAGRTTVGTGAHKASHQRRGHFKILRHERYAERRGDKVWVRPCWVGPEEVRIGRDTYRVRLDL